MKEKRSEHKDRCPKCGYRIPKIRQVRPIPDIRDAYTSMRCVKYKTVLY